jgi:hypothetical protein
MKKFKSILALTASVLALSAFAAPVSAFADNINFTNDEGNQTATHNEQATYTVTIPATVAIDTAGTGDMANYYVSDDVSVSAEGKIAASSTLRITATSLNGQKLKCGGVEADYDAKVGGNSIFNQGAVVLSANTTAESGALSGNATINYSAAKAGFTVAGEYTDTITFTIAVTNS